MDETYYKHYIRIDNNNRVVGGFSDAFPSIYCEILETDICINEQGGRKFELFGVPNPPLTDEHGVYIYKYVDSVVLERTAAEIQADIAKINVPISETELLKAQVQALSERNEFLEDCVAEMAMLVY